MSNDLGIQDYDTYDFDPKTLVRLNLALDCFEGKCGTCRSWKTLDHFIRERLGNTRVYRSCDHCKLLNEKNQKEMKALGYLKCECGSMQSRLTRARHMKTKKHRTLMAMLDKNAAPLYNKN